MADEQTPETTEENAENTNGEDISWEDAFREAAAGQTEPDDAQPKAASAPKAPPASKPDEGQSDGVDIDFLLDVKLNVTIEVGRTRMQVNELLQLQQGSVITLDKMVGEPFEVYVNGKLMAFGEIVVVNEKFGVRLTDIIDPKERIAQLG